MLSVLTFPFHLWNRGYILLELHSLDRKEVFPLEIIHSLRYRDGSNLEMGNERKRWRVVRKN